MQLRRCHPRGGGPPLSARRSRGAPEVGLQRERERGEVRRHRSWEMVHTPTSRGLFLLLCAQIK